ncbi:MAG: PEP-CTERM sorting domain-containing protein [Deltaproteobacteria bacterium]|nr:PEP-CTERM sorting domain-containing protein [Deltaproteobacteria bacterium]
MKKLAVFALAAMLVFGFAGQAMAYNYGTLVQFIYEGDVDGSDLYEVNTGLGSVKTGELTPLPRTVTAGQPLEDLSQFKTDKWSDLFVGFTSQYSYTVTVGAPYQKDTYKHVFMTTKSSNVPDVDDGYFTSFSGNASGLIATVPTPVTSKSSPTGGSWVSYWEYMEVYPAGFNTQGAYTGFNHNSAADSVVELDSLADANNNLVVGNFIDLYLWQYLEFDPYVGDTQRGFVGYDGAWADSPIAKIRIGVMADGDDTDLLPELYTQINPVPVPGSVLLLGSALLGLFGIRRKRS